MKLIEYPDREALAIDLAQTIAEELEEALLTHERVSFAVPGGTTPGPVFDSLCAADLDWARVTVLLGDERWVPDTAARSNAALLRERLLRDRAAAASFLPFFHSDLTPEAAMGPLAEAVRPLLPISVVLLGMGADMHTASLFPGADRLAEALAPQAPPVMALTAPGAPEPRLTLTGPVLQGAMAIHVVIMGQEKRTALNDAKRLNDPLVAPVSIVLPQATVHWAE